MVGEESILEDKCPECSSRKILEDKGEIVCGNCGLVISRLENGPEMEITGSLGRKNKSIKRNTPLIFSTTISNFYSENRVVKSNELLRTQNRMASSEEISLVRGRKEIQRFLGILNLSGLKEDAFLLYQKLVKENFTKGRKMSYVIPALIYYICRIKRIPRTLKEISLALSINQKTLSYTYREILKVLNVKMEPPSIDIYFWKIAEEGKYPIEVKKLAIKILNIIREKGIIPGKDPRGLAAAILYLAEEKLNWWPKLDQRQLAKIAGITEVTLRNRLKELRKIIGDIEI